MGGGQVGGWVVTPVVENGDRRSQSQAPGPGRPVWEWDDGRAGWEELATVRARPRRSLSPGL